MNVNEAIKLTQYAKGAGCGCKIAPQVLEEILKSQLTMPDNEQLLVGNSSKDDAAVYDIGNGQALISTTDFFTPVVDDPFDFGRIASANAISDVYAMGGRPILALAILGWPVDKIPVEHAQKVIEGSRQVCLEAGIQLAGGHSIDSPEPIFGLCVTGLVPVKNLKKNNTAQSGDLLFLTKPIGVGILSAAAKRGQMKEEHAAGMIAQMTALNKVGEALGAIAGVHAITDVTGFGLLGHLVEMCEGSGLSAELSAGSIQYTEGALEYAAQGIVPDATYRNWNAYSKDVSFEEGADMAKLFSVLPDPQTNGGLLIAVDENAVNEVTATLQQYGLDRFLIPIGKMVDETGKKVIVKP